MGVVVSLAEVRSKLAELSVGTLCADIIYIKPFMRSGYFKVKVTEQYGVWCTIQHECQEPKDVSKFLSFCRRSAKARWLEFKVCNRTELRDAELGIALEDKR